MFNFKRNTKVYLVEVNNPVDMYKHAIEVYGDLSASQTFNEQSYKIRTLHRPTHVHDGATISKANAANFSFTSPLFDYNTITNPILLKLATSLDTQGNVTAFDLYLDTDTEIIRIENCVIESLVFNLERNAIMTISISGTAGKISRGHLTVPGTPVSDVQNYTVIRKMSVTIDGIELTPIAAINVEFSNSMSWINPGTLQQTFSGAIAFPERPYLTDRTVSGSFSQFLTSDNAGILLDQSIGKTINVEIYSALDQVTPLLEFSLPSAVYTRRLDLGRDVITRVYDYRLIGNDTTVKPIYKGV